MIDCPRKHTKQKRHNQKTLQNLIKNTRGQEKINQKERTPQTHNLTSQTSCKQQGTNASTRRIKQNLPDVLYMYTIGRVGSNGNNF